MPFETHRSGKPLSEDPFYRAVSDMLDGMLMREIEDDNLEFWREIHKMGDVPDQEVRESMEAGWDSYWKNVAGLHEDATAEELDAAIMRVTEEWISTSRAQEEDLLSPDNR